MRSGNPALTSKTFEGLARGEQSMTLQGTVNKTALLLGLVFLAALWTWDRFFLYQDPKAVLPLIAIGGIGGFVMALLTIFIKKIAAYTSPIYAVLEGVAIGGISAFYEAQFPGIVIQAVGLTFGTLACLLLAYRSGLIRPSENFKLGVVAATGAIALLYVVNMVMGFFGHSIGFIHDSGPIGIGFSVVVVAVAALNLVLDFDFIEEGVAKGAPKYMEWYGAFGLLVTLVWLYLELLRLLSKMRR